MGNKKSAPRNYLSENDLILLENNTNLNREKIVQWHGAFLKDCPDGRLNKKQFIKLYKELEPKDGKVEKIEKYAEFVFNAFDTDKSGFIDFNEFLISFNVRSRGDLNQRLNWTFSVYDTDNNGYIDKKELKQMISLLHTMLDLNKKEVDGRVESIMNKLDTTGDRKLSREEFVNGIKNDEFLRKLLLEHELN